MQVEAEILIFLTSILIIFIIGLLIPFQVIDNSGKEDKIKVFVVLAIWLFPFLLMLLFTINIWINPHTNPSTIFAKILSQLVASAVYTAFGLMLVWIFKRKNRD